MKWGFSDQQQQVLDLPQLYTEVAKVKPQWWRLTAAWNYIAKVKDPSLPNARDWSTIDRSINDVLLLGCDVVMVIGAVAGGGFIPAAQRPWANATAAEYGSFAAEVATRYKPGGVGIRTDGKYAPNAGKGVRAFEIWNEQNNYAFWGLNVDPAGYVAYLKAAYTAIKAVSGLSGSNSTIVFGGLQHVGRSGPWYGQGWMTMPEITFVEKCYATEPALGSYYDVMADHIYTQSDTLAYVPGSTVGPAPTATTDNLLQLADIRALMVAKGDGAKKIWITEAGFATATMSEAVQSTYTQDLFTLLSSSPFSSYVDMCLIYNVRDNTPNVKDVEQTLGVMKYDYTKKAIWSWLLNFGPSGSSGTPMSATPTLIGVDTTADLFVKVKAHLKMGQKLTASTSIGMTTSAKLVNSNGSMVGTTSVGMSTTADMTVNGMAGATSIGMSTTANLQVLTMSGSTLIGIET